MVSKADATAGRISGQFFPSESKPAQEKTKKNQEKRLGFPWIHSSDSGLFNGLRAIGEKKNFRPFASWLRPAASCRHRGLSRSLRGRSAPVPPCLPRFPSCREPDHQKTLPRISKVRKNKTRPFAAALTPGLFPFPREAGNNRKIRRSFRAVASALNSD